MSDKKAAAVKKRLKIYKDTFSENNRAIKEYIIELKNYSPVSLVGIVYFFVLIAFSKLMSSAHVGMFIFITIVVGLISYIILKRVMDFRLLFEVDFSKSPPRLSVWEVSHKVSKRYEIVDNQGKPSILKNPFNCKSGEGYFINFIDEKGKLIESNMLHNNIDIIYDIMETFKEVNELTIDLQHKNNMLKAKEKVNSLMNAVKLIGTMELEQQLIEEAEKRDITDISAQSDAVRDMLEGILQKNKEEAEQNAG